MMKKFGTKKESLILVIVFVLFFAISILFPSVRFFINGNASLVNNLFVKPEGAANNIVLIKITDEDVEQLGWPLKRSYYALLIDRLAKLNVKAIGITIFFPRGVSSQSVYNNLLFNELRSKYNVVLSSIAEGLEKDSFIADTIKLPFFASLDSNIPVGHLNYFKGEYILIPNTIKSKGKNYYSFALSFSRLINRKIRARRLLYLNPIHPWEKFKSYSLLEFFTLLEKSNVKNAFNGKAVIIGVSAPLIAKSQYLQGMGNTPGIGLMALAVENILNGSGIKFYLFTPSKVFFWLGFLFVALFLPRKYWLTTTLALLTSFVLYLSFNIGIDFSSILLPAAAFISFTVTKNYLDKVKSIETIDLEKKRLQKELEKRIRELNSFKKLLEKADESEKLTWEEKINKLTEEIQRLKEAEKDSKAAGELPPEYFQEFYGIIYSSKSMAAIIETIKKVAPTDATVLITGESGSGKELVAKAIHNLSLRKNKSFVAVNCAAISESLLESELFGHVKGAFTNAVNNKKGLFEVANGGTIFLDEIGETSLNFQAKLLRVIQNGEYQKVGSPEKNFTDVRIIAATNKNLKKAVELKEFREDLFYRLNVVSVELPPLRKRKEEIILLANYFLKKEGEHLSFSEAIVEQLKKYDWPGNVRELESVVKRAAIFALGEGRSLVHLKDLPDEIRKGFRESVDVVTLNLLRKKKFSHSSIKEISKELGGISRTAVSENLRGLFFKFYVECNFNLEEASAKLADSNDLKTIARVKSKGEKYILNLKKDLALVSGNSFEKIKENFNAKYKNLPRKFHFYLDEVIKKLLSETSNKD